MRLNELNKAKSEAERFIAKIAELRTSDAYKTSEGDNVYGKEAAAVKRASSDLSAALSRLRNNK